MARLLVWVLFLVLSLVLPGYGVEFSNRPLSISFQLPDGYENMTKDMGGKVVIALRRLDAGTKTVNRIVVLQDLGASLEQNALPHPEAGQTNFVIESAHWKSFDLVVIKIVQPGGITFNVQIPFKPNAIQLTVFGPRSEEAKLRAEMQTILDYANGPTNWLTDKEIDQNIHWALIRVAIGAVLLIGLIVYFVRRKQV